MGKAGVTGFPLALEAAGWHMVGGQCGPQRVALAGSGSSGHSCGMLASPSSRFHICNLRVRWWLSLQADGMCRPLTWCLAHSGASVVACFGRWELPFCFPGQCPWQQPSWAVGTLFK